MTDTDTPTGAAPEEEELTTDTEEVEGEPAEEEAEPKAEEGEEGKETAPHSLTDAEVESALQTPRGQQIILDQLRQMAQEAQSAAEAKETLGRAKQLIADQDYEGLGKEYAKLVARHDEASAQQAQEKEVADRAVEYLYRNVIPTIAEEGDFKKVLSAMTKEERWDIHPDNPRFAGVSDAQYLATYLNVISQKRVSVDVESKAQDLFNEWKTAEENKRLGNIVGGSGSVNTPAGKPGESTSGDARSLIRAGLAEDSPTSEEQE